MKNTIFKAHPVSVQSTKAAYQGGILFGVKPVLHNPFFWGGKGKLLNFYLFGVACVREIQHIHMVFH